jgi:hypothetical protein
MQRKNNYSRPTNSSSKTLAEERKQTDLLKTLVTLQKSLGGQSQGHTDVPRLRLKNTKTYTFERTQIASTITASTTVDLAVGLYFSLDSLPSYTDFTNLFDSYRIVQVRVVFMPVTLGVTHTPLMTIIDYDDANPLTYQTALQYDSAQIVATNVPHERVLNPRAALAAYSGTFTSYSIADQRMWFDAGSPSVQFFGLKYVLPAATQNYTGGPLYYVNATYVLQFRSPR